MVKTTSNGTIVLNDEDLEKLEGGGGVKIESNYVTPKPITGPCKDGHD